VGRIDIRSTLLKGEYGKIESFRITGSEPMGRKKKEKIIEEALPLAVIDGDLRWDGMNLKPDPGLIKFQISGADGLIQSMLLVRADLIPPGLSHVDLKGTIHIEITARTVDERNAIRQARGEIIDEVLPDLRRKGVE